MHLSGSLKHKYFNEAGNEHLHAKSLKKNIQVWWKKGYIQRKKKVLGSLHSSGMIHRGSSNLTQSLRGST
jgi:hypothetical protein